MFFVGASSEEVEPQEQQIPKNDSEKAMKIEKKKKAKKNKAAKKAAAKAAKAAAENNDKIESSEAEVEPQKVYIPAPPPKENPWLKNKQQSNEPIEDEIEQKEEKSEKPPLELVMKESTAENRPPPQQTKPQPQPPIMPITKPIVSKSSSGSPWKTPPVEQSSTQVRLMLQIYY